jgi:hypothetical protein
MCFSSRFFLEKIFSSVIEKAVLVFLLRFHGIFFLLKRFCSSSSWSLVYFLVLFYDKNYKYGHSVLGGDYNPNSTKEYQTDHFFPKYLGKDNENQPDLELTIIKFLIATKAAIEHLYSSPHSGTLSRKSIHATPWPLRTVVCDLEIFYDRHLNIPIQPLAVSNSSNIMHAIRYGLNKNYSQQKTNSSSEKMNQRPLELSCSVLDGSYLHFFCNFTKNFY